MVYFANYLGCNFCARGTTSLLCGPEAQGFYNENFVSCFGWPYWTTAARNDGKSSWAAYLYQCNIPNVNTQRTTNINLGPGIDSLIRWQGRPFGLNLDSGMGVEFVKFTGSNPPQTESTNTYMAGYKRVAVSSRGNSVGISGDAAYGFTWGGWRLESSTGTVLTSLKATSLYYNSTYGSKNFKDIKNFFAYAT